MVLNIDSTIFCVCGGFWVSKQLGEEMILVCPICGNSKNIPKDTLRFQIKLYSKRKSSHI
ncbi:MAG: hypothetical protein ACW97Z_12130 [Candidatus Hodarchaeales archaeon]|jgi:hypothetical protein